MFDRHWCQKGRTSTPWGEDHTYQYDECMCVPHLGQGEGWPSLGGGKGLLEVEGQGVLQDLMLDVGQLVLSQVPVEEWCH